MRSRLIQLRPGAPGDYGSPIPNDATNRAHRTGPGHATIQVETDMFLVCALAPDHVI